MRPGNLSFALVVVACSAFAAPDDELQHDWRQESSAVGIRFISKQPAPPPFSLRGEPEAEMFLTMRKLQRAVMLSTVVDQEIENIRRTLELGPYLEQDGYQPKDGIVSYVERINGWPVAFLKYRVVGLKGLVAMQPRSVRRAIWISNDEVYALSLDVLFARHQEEVRADQIRLIKGLVGK